MGLDDGADVGGQSRVLVFAAPSAARREVLQAADPVLLLVQPLLDRVASPAEASLGLAGAAAAEHGSDLGLEQAALVSGEAPGPGPDQGVVLLNRVIHSSGPARGKTVTDQEARLFREGRITRF